MCGRTCVGVTSGKKDRTHALRTHVLEFILHAHVRPHIARVRARTHLRNQYLVKYFVYSKSAHDFFCFHFTTKIQLGTPYKICTV